MTGIVQRTIIKAPIQRCFDLARSVEVHLMGNVHFGEQVIASGGLTSGLIGLGQRVTWKAKHFWVWHSLTSQITVYHPPVYFQDTMVSGIFRSMQHDHCFQSIEPCVTEMRDVFRFAAPVPVLGRIVELILLRRYMAALLYERNQIVKRVAEGEDWKRYLPE